MPMRIIAILALCLELATLVITIWGKYNDYFNRSKTNKVKKAWKHAKLRSKKRTLPFI